MRRWLALIVFLALVVVAVYAAWSARSVADRLAGVASGRTQVVDLTYALNDRLPAWPGDEHPFEATAKATFEKEGYFSRGYYLLEHYGTHMDAPAHFVQGQATVDQIAPQRLIGSAVVVDIQEKVAADGDYRLTRRDLQAWERQWGRIPDGAIVLARTGWAARWPDVARYRNTDQAGVMHFPGFGVDAAEFLTKERKVSGLGIDTLSVDYGPSKNFEVHRITLAAGLYHLENLASMERLPAKGAYLVAAPIKLEGGSGGAVRVMAILP
jgi:kynurenine formamidase